MGQFHFGDFAHFPIGANTHPGRFSDAQLRTLQRRMKDWRRIMAQHLVYAGSDEPAPERSDGAELVLVGARNKVPAVG